MLCTCLADALLMPRYRFAHALFMQGLRISAHACHNHVLLMSCFAWLGTAPTYTSEQGPAIEPSIGIAHALLMQRFEFSFVKH